MVKLDKIEFIYWEGKHFFRNPYRTWEDANKAVSKEACSAPDDGAYDKLIVEVTWEDGTTFKHRFDLQHKHWGSSMALSDEIVRYNRFYAGKHKPDTIPEQTYQQILKWSLPEEHAMILDHYDLGVQL